MKQMQFQNNKRPAFLEIVFFDLEAERNRVTKSGEAELERWERCCDHAKGRLQFSFFYSPGS